MNKKYYYAAAILLSLLVAGVQPVPAQIYIPGDTSVGTWDGSTYTLNTDVQADPGTHGLVIMQGNLTLDGAGYTVSGTSGNNESGVYVDGTTYVGISDVTIENVKVDGFHYGVYVRGAQDQHSAGNVLMNNVITNSYSAGIRLEYCSENDVTGNSVSDCGAFGIALVHSSYYFTEGGPPPGNTVSGNTVSNNGWGIYIQWASNNTIYQNNFINNTTQAEQYGGGANSGNVFNLPSPDGGNYWSNWTSPDGNGDGFVDDPYEIHDVYSNPHYILYDYLPWTEQDGWLTEEEDVIDFFDAAVTDGTLVGVGSVPAVAEFRLNLMRALLEIADALIVEGRVPFARFVLELAYDFTDGQPWPMDLVEGDAAPELATRIQAWIDSLE